MRSIATIQSVGEALKGGSLELPLSPVPLPPASEPAWSSIPVNSALVLIFTFWMVLNIRSLIFIMPHLANCLSRWKGSVNLDNSIQLSRERNRAVRLMFFCFGMLAARYSLLRMDIISRVPDMWQTPAVIGVMLAAVILRRILYVFMSPYVRKHEIFHSAYTSAYNFFVWMVLVMLVATGAFIALHVPASTCRSILIWICLVFYGFYLIRKTQIFRSGYTKFASFLYLCALEFLPTAALIAAATLL